MNIKANLTYYKILNQQIRQSSDTNIILENVTGQRYLACGTSSKHFKIYGTPGNGLGQYMNGGMVEVFGNAQEAVGDTMNDGTIIIHGNCGDACGYGMRGGEIFVKDNCGYRGGIHMKSYENKKPVLVIGGKAGSFLGEYLAGGLILVLGIGQNGKYPVSNFCGTGMHGGKIVVHCNEEPKGLPAQVLIKKASQKDMDEIIPYIDAYCKFFGENSSLKTQTYYVLTPNPDAGYQRLYTYE